MTFPALSVRDFTDRLASKDPVPGGGGASALVGSLGAALGSMVCNLTLGKKKYAAVEEEIERLLCETEALRAELLSQIDGDAACFAPLAEAYRLPPDDPNRAEVLEKATKDACTVPLAIMEASVKAIDLHERLAAIGSRLAISDVGVGVLLCKSALMGASLNVFINTKTLRDRTAADEIDRKADALLQQGTKKADAVYASVLAGLR